MVNHMTEGEKADQMGGPYVGAAFELSPLHSAEESGCVSMAQSDIPPRAFLKRRPKSKIDFKKGIIYSWDDLPFFEQKQRKKDSGI